MRQLTKEQIIDAIGATAYSFYQVKEVSIINNQIDMVSKRIDHKEEHDMLEALIEQWLEEEMEQIPDEAKQHLLYLTCHPTLKVTFSIVKE